MKNLIFIRHSKSSWELPLNDIDRPLSNRGIHNAHLVSSKIENLLPKSFIIWSSNAKRAKETAMIFSQNLLFSFENISIKEPFTKKVLLKKNINAEEQKIIDSLNLDNIEIEVRHSRHYPLGEQISTLIGFYGKDRAQEGLEKSYDSMLSGQSGRQKYFVNAKQRIISKPIEVSKTIDTTGAGDAFAAFGQLVCA